MKRFSDSEETLPFLLKKKYTKNKIKRTPPKRSEIDVGQQTCPVTPAIVPLQQSL